MFFSRRTFIQKAAGAVLGGACALALPMRPALAAAPITETRLLMGTFVTCTLGQCSREQALEGLDKAYAEAIRLIALFDRHTSSSALGILNSQGSLADCPPELTSLLLASARIGKLSEHAYNISVAPVVDLLQKQRDALVQEDLIQARSQVIANSTQAALIQNNKVRLPHAQCRLTLDGIAKGAVADAMSKALLQNGIHHHLVNAGGDIVAQGQKSPGKSWTVAVDNPLHRPGGPKPYLSILSLSSGQALATSGTTEAYYGARSNHLVSPLAGKSPNELISVSALTHSAQDADALATALSVMPLAQGQSLVRLLPGTKTLMLTKDGQRV